MFGWLKKKFRREQIKLVVQTRLCAEFLKVEFDNACAAGLANPQDGINPFSDVEFACGELTYAMQNSHSLDPKANEEILRVNRALRLQYDEWLAGKKVFANQFGSASQPLRSFDQAFQPNEGWKIFLANFEREFPLT